jgi:very-short-patch-repair endonuclease
MREGEKIATARNLRHRQTDAEKILWRFLRNRSLEGTKFRRQHPIGRYVVDFVCLDLKLVIELDGGQHAANQLADELRTEELKSRGFHVIRIWNNDMLSNRDGVFRILEQAIKAPSPQPSPASGRGSSREPKLNSPRPLAGEGGTRREAVGG